MSFRTINYLVTPDSISPFGCVEVGVAGEHLATQINFNLSGIVIGENDLIRVDIRNGAGGFYASELLTLSEGTISLLLPEEVTAIGGVAQLNLVITTPGTGDSRIIRYSFPARIKFEESAVQSVGYNRYATDLSGLASQALQAAQAAELNALSAHDSADAAVDSESAAAASEAAAANSQATATAAAQTALSTLGINSFCYTLSDGTVTAMSYKYNGDTKDIAGAFNSIVGNIYSVGSYYLGGLPSGEITVNAGFEALLLAGYLPLLRFHKINATGNAIFPEQLIPIDQLSCAKNDRMLRESLNGYCNVLRGTASGFRAVYAPDISPLCNLIRVSIQNNTAETISDAAMYTAGRNLVSRAYTSDYNNTDFDGFRQLTEYHPFVARSNDIVNPSQPFTLRLGWYSTDYATTISIKSGNTTITTKSITATDNTLSFTVDNTHESFYIQLNFNSAVASSQIAALLSESELLLCLGSTAADYEDYCKAVKTQLPDIAAGDSYVTEIVPLVPSTSVICENNPYITISYSRDINAAIAQLQNTIGG